MTRSKKLQVFVSSTYADLKEERQSAVEAILTAGHIPAGMELFAAGDTSQMAVIKNWIDESDVFLLILGGRYGSIEADSQKSYIHLEYEYAIARGKPVFAVVIDPYHLEERVRQLGTKAIETEHPQKLKDFRSLVLTRMVRFWRDPRDIKLAILETMSDFSRRPDLIGWVPGSEAANAGTLAEEIARLVKENALLREQVGRFSGANSDFAGLTFDELYDKLARTKIDDHGMSKKNRQEFLEVARIFGDTEPGLLHAFWMLSDNLRRQDEFEGTEDNVNIKILSKLEDFALIEHNLEASRAASEKNFGDRTIYRLTESGRRFLLRLRLERDAEEAESYIIGRLAKPTPTPAADA